MALPRDGPRRRAGGGGAGPHHVALPPRLGLDGAALRDAVGLVVGARRHRRPAPADRLDGVTWWRPGAGQPAARGRAGAAGAAVAVLSGQPPLDEPALPAGRADVVVRPRRPEGAGRGRRPPPGRHQRPDRPRLRVEGEAGGARAVVAAAYLAPGRPAAAGVGRPVAVRDLVRAVRGPRQRLAAVARVVAAAGRGGGVAGTARARRAGAVLRVAPGALRRAARRGPAGRTRRGHGRRGRARPGGRRRP